MLVYRLSKEEFCNDLSGRGARDYGGRWNSKGYPVIYTSESRSLAAFELAVHLNLFLMPTKYMMVKINIPEDIDIESVNSKKLSTGWNSFPVNPITQKIGDAFINKNESLVLKVPSVVIPSDFNYLINPLHKDIKKVTIVDIEPFSYDNRIKGQK